MPEARTKAGRAKDSMAMGGTLRFIRHDVSQVKPSGPGPLAYEELFKRAADGSTVPRAKHAGLIDLDRTIHNKITKRGLSYFLMTLVKGHNSVADDQKVANEITGDTTSNPFQALLLMADYAGYPADAKVEWTESDLGNDSKIPPAPTLNDGTSHALYQGRRGILTSKTTDPGIKKMSKANVGAPPYGEGEMVFYSPSPLDSLIKATGYVDATGVAAWVDGTDIFTIDDGINPAVVFEFDTHATGSLSTAGRVRIDVNGAPSLPVVAARIAAAINAIGTKLYISAEVDDVITARVNLTHYAGGSIGNVSITEAVNDANFTVNGMSGGTDPSMDDDQICHFPIKSIGLAREVNCGNGETNSKVGMRAIVGLAPTNQGKADVRWVHEKINFIASPPTMGADLHHYIDDNAANRQTILGQSGVDGYVARSAPFPDPVPPTVGGERADDVLATFDPGVTITSATKTFDITSAEWGIPDTIGFDVEHMRLVLRVTNSATGGNNKDYHIREINNSRQVETFEAPAADDDDTTTPALQVQLVRTYRGGNCFDGNVANEGSTEAPVGHSEVRGTIAHGEKWVSENTSGPHTVGRVWGAASKLVKRVRIVAPPGVTREYLPDEFQIQYLDPTKVTTAPDDLRPGDDAHWTDIPAGEGDYTSGGEAAGIYTAGQYGVEYVFTNPTPACYGIRLKDIRSEDDIQRVEIAQLMIAEEVGGPEGFPITLSGDRLKFSVDGGVTDVFVDLPDVAATSDMDELVDAINGAVVGYGVEAVRSTFGFLWFRATVQGDNSTVRVYNYGKSGALGLTSGSDVNRTGLTQTVTQLTMSALTIIYRFSVWGNKPLAV